MYTFKRNTVLLVSALAIGICLGLLAAYFLPMPLPLHRVLAGGRNVVALGSEPGWRLEISGAKQMNALLDYGELVLSSDGPVRIIPLTGDSVLLEYMEAKLMLSVILIRGKCVDAMKGDNHDLSVVISYENKIYWGCGDFVSGM